MASEETEPRLPSHHNVEVQTESESDIQSTASATQQTGGPPWYKNSRYNRYWKHQKATAEWFKQYKETKHQQDHEKGQRFVDWCRKMKDYHSSMSQWMQHLGSYYSQWYQTWLQYQMNQTRQTSSTFIPNKTTTSSMANRQQNPTSLTTNKKRRSNNRHSRSKKRRKKLSCSVSDLDLDTSEGHHGEVGHHGEEGHHGEHGHHGDHFKMEFTDEMIEFYSQSARHKQERDAKKKALSKAETEDHVNLGEASVGKNKASVLPPSERPGARRTTEMKALYGKGAAMIHGMETAMQLNYDRNCDRQQPKLWPQLPLKIQFHVKH